MDTEVITHRVNERWDDGATVGVKPIPIYDVNEDAKVLQARVLPFEHRLQIKLLQQVVREEVREIYTETQYIRPGEERILRDARRHAREKYPNG